jgi:hypothetical protein
MSGIPRPDPAVPAGSITVRCLLGSFSSPAVAAEVTLELQGADGVRKEERRATTGPEGRATFDGLADWVGGRAVARVVLQGQELRSQPIAIEASMGTRVMLVAGADGAGAPPPVPSHGAPPPDAAAGPHGGSGDVPAPGDPFPIRELPPGTLVVGTLDLRGKGRAEGIEVLLELRRPDGAREERRGTSDAQGRVVFKGLLPPEVPAGTKLVASARILADGEPQRSKEFEMGQEALALYLAEGLEQLPAQEPAPAAYAAARPPVPPPQRDPSIPPDTVLVSVLGPAGEPVAGQLVEVWKKDVTGNDVRTTATTGADGVARVSGVVAQADALYFVGVLRDAAPWQSRMFELDGRSGVRVALRVFPITHDASKVRAAIQLEVSARENDLAQVIQAQQAMVEGDAAYWPEAGALRLRGPAGAKGFTVLGAGEQWLEHAERAPFATLAGPLPPGEVVDLSIAYLVPHDGTLDLEVEPPFPLVDANLLLPRELALRAPDVAPGQPQRELPPELALYPLGPRGHGAPLAIVVDGLPVRPPIFRRVAAGILVLLGGLVVWAVRRTPRRSRIQQLAEEVAAAEQRLEAALPEERARIVAHLDDLHRRLDALRGRQAAAAP